MSQEFEKVSILKDADVTYSSQSGAVPPAGNVEVLGYLHMDGRSIALSTARYDIPGNTITELVDRAHVTRLTAERDGLKADLDSERKLRRELGVRVHELKDQAKDQQSELTKARELLSKHQWEWEPHDTHGEREGGYYCIECGAHRPEGHKADCVLSIALANQSAPAANFIACNVDESCGQNAPAAKGESDE